MSATIAPTAGPEPVRFMGKYPVFVAEVSASMSTSCRVIVAYSKAFNDAGRWFAMPFGCLTWDPKTKAIELIYVDDTMRRKGIATAMWDLATTIEPDLQHSGVRSNAGNAWARSVSGAVPPLTELYSERSATGEGASLLVRLDSFTAVALEDGDEVEVV